MSGMRINVDKSKITVFRNGGFLRSYETWHYQGLNIELVNIYKYLGAYFTPTLSWTKTQDILSKQGNKASAQIYKFQKGLAISSTKMHLDYSIQLCCPFCVTLLKYGNMDIVKKLKMCTYLSVNVLRVWIEMSQFFWREASVDVFNFMCTIWLDLPSIGLNCPC